MKIQVGDKSGQDIVVALFEPKSGLFWWEYQRLDEKSADYAKDRLTHLLKQYRVAMEAERIVSFRLEGSRLYIRDSTEKVSSFEQGLQSVVSMMEQNLKDIHGDPLQGRLTIPLASVLGKDFFHGSKFVAQWRPSTLVDAKSAGSKWLVDLEGPDGERARVTVGDDYKVEGATRSGNVVFPAK